MEKYRSGREIGKGSFGSVRLAYEKPGGKTVVIKEVKIHNIDQSDRPDARTEVEVLAQLRHTNIVRYVESFENKVIG